MASSLGVEEVHEALLCLYTPTELAKTTLAAEVLPVSSPGDVVARAQVLRDLLLDALEALRPAGGASPSASASRAYECLTYRYVTGMSVEDVAYELHLSPRQVYRDLRWGEERLTALLQSRLASRTDPDASFSSVDSLTAELASLELSREPVDLAEAICGVRAVVEPLAQRLGLTIDYRGPASGVWVYSTPGLLRSLLAQILSTLVQRGGPVCTALLVDGSSASLSLAVGDNIEEVRRDLSSQAVPLLEALRIDFRLRQDPAGARVELAFPVTAQRVVLVVEDNPGARALYERYLEDTEWHPVMAEAVDEVPTMASQSHAEAVILDIMMPETDGWSVLQALRLDPLTARLPVVICSVLSDQELGAALGATAYLTKPVTRPQLLAALRQAQPPGTPA